MLTLSPDHTEAVRELGADGVIHTLSSAVCSSWADAVQGAADKCQSELKEPL